MRPPRSRALTASELAEFRELLTQMEARIGEVLDVTSPASSRTAGSAWGAPSRVAAGGAVRDDGSRRQRLTIQRDQIRVALRKLERGDYGTCGWCGQAIDIERLRGRPESLFCRDCVRLSGVGR